MKKTRFYSLDFSYSLRHHIGAVSAWVWVVIFVILLCLLQFGAWFWDQYNKPALDRRLADFDSVAKPIAELNADWKKAKKRYDPLHPLMAAEDKAPVLSFVGALDALLAPARVSGDAAASSFRPDFRIRSLVVERGSRAKCGLTLLLPETDRQAYFERSKAFFTGRLDSVAVLAESGVSNKVSVSISWDKGGAITPETTALDGSLELSVEKGKVDVAEFPPVANDVGQAAEIVEKWQKRVAEYKFSTGVPWYRKPFEFFSKTTKSAEQSPANFTDLIASGKGLAEFERARIVHVDPLRISQALVVGHQTAVKAVGEDAEAVKKAKSALAAATGIAGRFDSAWREMASRRSPYRREKAFPCRELDEDLARIQKVSSASVPRAKYIAKCLEQAELHRNAITNGVRYKHVFQETTFRDRVALPPFRKALAEAGAKGWAAVLDGVQKDADAKKGADAKKDKSAASAESEILFPEWSVGVGPNAEGRGTDVVPVSFETVRQAVANVEKSPARLWVTRLSVSFAEGAAHPSWPAVSEFTVVGRVPCWGGE